jgi:hypothetical protein
MCTQDFLTNMAEHIVEEKKILRFVNTVSGYHTNTLN